MKPKIIIRADGGTSIGMGHVIRCIALADMLKNNFDIAYAIQAPTESVIHSIHSVTANILHLPISEDYQQDAFRFSEFLNPADIVVLDGYYFKTDYQKIIKNKGCKLVVIDDLHDWHHVADVIINNAFGITENLYSKEKYTKLFSGPEYALLRKAFLKPVAELKKTKAIREVFISMGAADVNNLTEKFSAALTEIPSIEVINLMLGSINPNLSRIDAFIEKNKKVSIQKHFDISAEQLAELLKKSDLVICPASSISMESCAIGVGLISGYTAENQKGILKGLVDLKTIVNFGDLNQITKEQIVSSISTLFTKPEQFDLLIGSQRKMIDGKSSKRILNIFQELMAPKIHFRFACEADVDLYFKWTNDSVVRSNSYNQQEVLYENHVKWFRSKLASPNCFLYLFLNEEGQAIGQVRIDKNENETVIGISIDLLFRGKKLGSELLKMASEDYLKKHSTDVIAAYIKIENRSSYNSFIKAGFGNEEMVNEHGFKSYKLYKKNS